MTAADLLHLLTIGALLGFLLADYLYKPDHWGR